MRQTTEHQSYAGSVGASPSYGLNPAFHSPDHHSGFTLVEIVVAMAILMVVVLGMLSSYASYYGRVAQERLATTGQNLAQLQLEDVLSLDKSVLYNLALGGDNIDVNYVNTASSASPGYPPISDISASSSVYDSGIVDGTFYITGIRAVYAPSMSPSVSHQLPAGLSDVPNLDLPSGIVDLQPESHTSSGVTTWDYTVILNKAVFPGYQRRVVITDTTPSIGQAANKLYKIEVTIFWTVMGRQQQYTVSAEK
ncbi:MAG TPA: type II secretion system protein [Candidatus Cryosericum sp.]